ncbi:MAG: hypothetical protein V5A16_01850 [Haloplanus sp.]
MDDGRPLRERVEALERAVTDGHAADGLPDAGRIATRVDDLEAAVEEMSDRIAELEAAVQALRGFAGGVRAVDESVERRANAAIARVDRLEAELERIDTAGPGDHESAAETNHHESNPGPHDGAIDGLEVGAREGAATERVGSPPDGDSERLHGAVTAQSDAALAEMAASSDRPGRESDGDRSLADRLRRLL